MNKQRRTIFETTKHPLVVLVASTVIGSAAVPFIASMIDQQNQRRELNGSRAIEALRDVMTLMIGPRVNVGDLSMARLRTRSRARHWLGARRFSSSLQLRTMLIWGGGGSRGSGWPAGTIINKSFLPSGVMS